MTTVDPEGQETFPYTTEIRLAKNKDYRVVFWAQNDECVAYELNNETMEVAVSYEGLNNDEKRDAFYAYKDLKITGSVEEDITLYRPFAQLNVGVTAEDWNAAVTSNSTVRRSKVTVKKVANTINLFSGVIGENTTDVTYEYSEIPTEMLMIDTDNDGTKEGFYYLSMSYLLAEKADVSVDFMFETDTNEIDLSIATVPVERNHRTNIIGNILTGNVSIKVMIDAEFDGENNFNIIWGGEIAEPEINENGEYIIMTGANLAWLAHATNGTLPTGEAANTFAGKTFKLVNNIDLGNNHWTPIGYWATFEGTFDGQGYTISNLKHHGTEADCYVGLFGNTVNATIKNLTINNVDIKLVANNSWAGGHVGALIGHIEEDVTIENVTIKGLVKLDGALDKAGAGRIGGVVGGNNSNSGATFRNVHVIADEGSFVKGNNAVGGIAGHIFNGALIFENCSSNIDVTAQQFYAGGIIGMASINTKLTNCSTSGDITVVAGRAGKVHDLYRVGGIVGCWGDRLAYPLVLENCSYTGKVVGPADGNLDCDGYVGRGYEVNVGAIVIVNGTEYRWNGNGYDF